MIASVLGPNKSLKGLEKEIVEEASAGLEH